MTDPIALDEVLLARRVVVCCGSGGVGKTTCSAALALAAARRGRRALVCTIDPAKRLANSLGISELGNEELLVPREKLAEGGVELAPGGSLSAMMLDTKRTFDKLIERYAAPEVAKRIFENHIYVKFSGQLAGSQEYMAMEKLYELYGSGRYDLIVLDTPPSKHALDFLSAPKRLGEFLEGSVISWFTIPYFGAAGRLGLGIMQRFMKKVVDWLDQLFGLEMLKELSEFFQAFEPLWGGFKERAEKVNALLTRADAAAFVIVTSPTRETVSEADYFIEQLRASGMPIAGVIANRVHTDFLGEGAAAIEAGALREAARSDDQMLRLEAAADRAFSGDRAALAAVRKAIENFCEFAAIAEADRAHLAPLAADARKAGLFFREIPAFERDVHDVAGLGRLDRWLLGSPTQN